MIMSQRVGMIYLALYCGALGCSSHTQSSDEGATKVASQALVTTNDLGSEDLQLTVSKSSCALNTAQDNFSVLNAGGSPAKLSDIVIKYWVNDTSGSPIVPHVWYGGCATTANGTCTHQVTDVSITATQFPSCGSDSTHQANWEITITTTDPTPIDAGMSWTGVQTGINRTDFGNFSPGSGTWFSGCGTNQPFASDPSFAVYSQGNLVTSGAITAPSCRAPHGTQQLSGYLNKPEVANAPIVGLVPLDTSMGLTVALPLKAKNSDGLSVDDFINQVSDPASPQYRHYLTPDQFASTFGPDPADYQALLDWAGSVGLNISKTYSNNSLVYLSGSAAAIDKALFANIVQRTRPDGSIFHSLDREPSINFSIKVLQLSGLENFVLPKPAAASDIPCPTATPGSPTQNGSGDQGAFIGKDFRNLYASCTSLDGGGAFPQRIGLFEEADFSQLDISEYLKKAGIPDKVIPQQTVNFSGAPHPFDLGTEEVLLDIDLAASMAPGSDITVFGGLGPDAPDFANGVFGLMATSVPLVNVISSSWLFSVDDETAQLAAQFAAQGQSLFQSSGDDGFYNTDPFDNRRLPYATLVGATIVSTSGVGGPYLSESGWAGSGGGEFPGIGGFLALGIPNYQRGVVASPDSGVDQTLRNAPDVSMLGANTEILRQCTPQVVGGIKTGEIDCNFINVCGTSASTPLWAAFMALVNQKTEAAGIGRLGFVNPVLYGIEKNAAVYASSFNDVTSGNNTRPALPGYDLVTGIGSPKCALIDQLASPNPTQPIDSNPPPPPVCSSAHMDFSGEAGQLFSDGPDICGSGTGFTPGGDVTIDFVGAPSGHPAQTHRIGSADASGNIKFLDLSQRNAENPIDCNQTQLEQHVTIIVTDVTSGCTITDLESASFWCPNGNKAQFGGGC